MNDTVKLRSTTVRVGSQRLRVVVERRGAGMPLLLINGIGATGDLFRPFTAHLTDRETFTFDAPGVGGSPTPLYPPTLKTVAAIVAGMIDELGHERVDVLGVSWGGALAQELARRHGASVRRLVLVSTTPGVISVPGRPIPVSILMSPLRYYSQQYLDRVAPTLYGGAIRDNPKLLHEHAQIRASLPPNPFGYYYQVAALRRWSSLPWLHRLEHPTLVMCGDDDPITPLVNSRLIAGRLAHGRLEVIEGGGHLFIFTKAARIAAMVRSFLDEERTSTPTRRLAVV